LYIFLSTLKLFEKQDFIFYSIRREYFMRCSCSCGLPVGDLWTWQLHHVAGRGSVEVVHFRGILPVFNACSTKQGSTRGVRSGLYLMPCYISCLNFCPLLWSIWTVSVWSSTKIWLVFSFKYLGFSPYNSLVDLNYLTNHSNLDDYVFRWH
jgi:hypothetical protein